jgi:hypothetical protein
MFIKHERALSRCRSCLGVTVLGSYVTSREVTWANTGQLEYAHSAS